MEPTVGIEPTTCALRMQSEIYKNINKSILFVAMEPLWNHNTPQISDHHTNDDQ